MTDDDVLFRFRLRLLALAEELGNTRAACRAMGACTRPPSTAGAASCCATGARACGRGGAAARAWPTRPRSGSSSASWPSPSAIPVSGPRRIAAELARPVWGGQAISANGVWRVLARHGLSTRPAARSRGRLRRAARRRSPREPEPGTPPRRQSTRRDAADGLLLIGRLRGTAGGVWQYTAIDVASSFVWASLHASANPTAEHPRPSRAAPRVDCGQPAISSSACSRTTATSSAAPSSTGPSRRSARCTASSAPDARRATAASSACSAPSSRGCWKSAFARHVIPRYQGLRRDLEHYLGYYNRDRARTGRWNSGRTPAEVLGKAACYS